MLARSRISHVLAIVHDTTQVCLSSQSFRVLMSAWSMYGTGKFFVIGYLTCKIAPKCHICRQKLDFFLGMSWPLSLSKLSLQPMTSTPSTHPGAMPASLSASAGNSRPVQCPIGSRDCPILVIHYVSHDSRTLFSSLNRAYNIPELSVGPISTTQPTPTHRKVNTLDPQTNPTHNP